MEKNKSHSVFALIIDIIQDTDRKSMVKILSEFWSLFWKYRELPMHYFTHYLYKKGTNDVRNYLPNKLSSKIPSSFNEDIAKQVLDDKLYFSLFYSRYGINLPSLIAYNNKEFFTVGNKTTVIKNEGDFRRLVSELFRQHQSCDTFFIKKTNSSSGGKNIHILTRESTVNGDALLTEIYNDLARSSFVFQERVKQHPELNRLNPSSLNTIRFDTFVDQEGEIEILSGLLKISTNNSQVDNLSTGGCAIGIDLNSGRLRKTGYAKMKFYSTETLQEHPITGVKFEGFTIPFIAEAIEMIKKAAGLMPALRLVGWDVGIGENGPVLIEGNSDYGLSTNDFIYGGYLTNDTFMKILREFKSR